MFCLSLELVIGELQNSENFYNPDLMREGRRNRKRGGVARKLLGRERESEGEGGVARE